jgi:hypothetical protein
MPAPKKHVRTQSTDARTAPSDPAAALIAAVERGTAKPLPSVEALAALQKLIAHNDSASAQVTRVGSAAAIDMLRTHYGWSGSSIGALNGLCRRAFGRASWGKP